MEGQGDPDQTTPQGNKESASSFLYPIRFIKGSSAVETVANAALQEFPDVQNAQSTQSGFYYADRPISCPPGGFRLSPLPAETSSSSNQSFAMSENTKNQQQAIRSAQLSAEEARKRQRREALLAHYWVDTRAGSKPGEHAVIVRTTHGDEVAVNPPKPFFATGLCVYDGPPGEFVHNLRIYFPNIRRAHYRKLCWSTLTAIEQGLWGIGNLLQRVKLLGYTDIDCNVLFVANGMSWDGLDCDVSSHLSETRMSYYKNIIKRRKTNSRLSAMRRRYYAGEIQQRKEVIDPEILRKMSVMRLDNPESCTSLSAKAEARDRVMETGTTQEPSSAPDKGPNQLNKEGQLHQYLEEQMEEICLRNDKQCKDIEDLQVAKRLHYFRMVQQDAYIEQQNQRIFQQEARINQQEARLKQLKQQFELQMDNNQAVQDPQAQSDQPPTTIQTPFPAAQNGTAEAALEEDWPASPTESTTSSESWTEVRDFR